MVGMPRPKVPDRRPPLPPPLRARVDSGPIVCARCGAAMLPEERDDGDSPRHLVCDPTARTALARRIEATRSIQRVIAALATVPPIHARLADTIAAVPDACDVGDALHFLEQARNVVECTPSLTSQQRRVANSFLDATLRKLSG